MANALKRRRACVNGAGACRSHWSVQGQGHGTSVASAASVPQARQPPWRAPSCTQAIAARQLKRRTRGDGRADCPKTRESSSGPQPSRASIESGGVYAGFAAISSQGCLPPPEKKLLPCSFRARKCAAFQRKLCWGGSLPGELAPPSTSLFDKLKRAEPSDNEGSAHFVCVLA